MRFLTDHQAALVPTLQGKDRPGRDQLLSDAEHVYRWVSNNRMAEDAQLRKHAEGLGINPDRLNEAVSLLLDAGKLIGINPVNPVALAPVAQDGYEAMTVAELLELPEAQQVEGRYDMLKAELIYALRNRPALAPEPTQ